MHPEIQLVLQLAVILLAAKLGAELAQRGLKQPAVLGELAVGVLIGPYALGSLPLPGVGQLFPPAPGSAIPVSGDLFGLAQIASVVLLFAVGLETDLRQFLRFGPSAAAVAFGGVVLPFALGVAAAVLFGVAAGVADPKALFLGAVLTATSIGITARVLADIGKLDTAEGVTVLGGAVVDDVLGILILAVAAGVALNGGVSLLEVGLISAKAIGFWLGLTGLMLLLAGRMSRLLLSFRAEGAATALALALALGGAFLAESFGLALIVGAYSIGLALSQTGLARTIEHQVHAVYQVFGPVFFVVMGMLVNVAAIGPVLGFGLVVTVLAILGKLLGAGLPALAVGFTPLGALRIGLGMVPRGEVALIVAGVGLTSGIVGGDIFGVAVLMTVVTTLLGPVLLGPAFLHGGPGRRDLAAPRIAEVRYVVDLVAGAAELFLLALTRVLTRERFALVQEVRDPGGPTFEQYVKDDERVSFTLEPLRAGRHRLVLELETRRCRELLVATVQEGTRELLSGSLQPVEGTRDGALAAGVRQSIADLLTELERAAGRG